ncbi:MAG: chromate transporter [Bacteroidales bacterium]
MIYLELFWVFLQIGLFGFGGGYAMLSMIQHEVVVKYAWLNYAQFADIVAVSQVTPGPIGINCATYVGYTAANQAHAGIAYGILGSLLASLAICLPSLIFIWGVMKLLVKYQQNIYVKNALSALKLSVLGLIFSAALLMMNSSNFIDYKSILICLIVFILSFSKRLSNPILLILLSGLAGYIFY